MIMEFKIPIIIMIISLIVNSSMIENFMYTIPMISANNQLNIFGVLLKAMLIGLGFYIFTKYF